MFFVFLSRPDDELRFGRDYLLGVLGAPGLAIALRWSTRALVQDTACWRGAIPHYLSECEKFYQAWRGFVGTVSENTLLPGACSDNGVSPDGRDFS